MKGLLKLFVKSILSPATATLYMLLSFWALLALTKHGNHFLGFIIFIGVTGSLILLHVGRRAVEKEAKSQAGNAGKDIITK